LGLIVHEIKDSSNQKVVPLKLFLAYRLLFQNYEIPETAAKIMGATLLSKSQLQVPQTLERQVALQKIRILQKSNQSKTYTKVYLPTLQTNI
jgi:hypothetical protein